MTVPPRKGSPVGLVTLGSGVGTNPGCVPRFPGSRGQGGGAPLPEPRSRLCTPGQKANQQILPCLLSCLLI